MNKMMSEAEFCELAGQYDYVPVHVLLPGDRETPISLYEKLVGDGQGFLLESAEANRTFGRYSFLGFHPEWRLTGRAKETVVETQQGEEILALPPLEALREVLGRCRVPDIAGLPPLRGGFVGYLAFEGVTTWERVRGMNVPDDMVLLEAFFCRDMAVLDHLTHSVALITWSRGGSELAEAYEQACSRLETMQAALNAPGKELQQTLPGVALTREAKAETFLEGVRKVKEHIVAGDTFQTVLSLPFHRPQRCHPFQLYRRLRRVNPSPYMFYLQFGRKQLVGASPEMLVRVEDDRVSTYPIAGTRRRGADRREDAALEAELVADPKERAEHAMLVDLGRNDLGRVSTPGTVEVTRLMQVEYFSHVMHMVSEVQGKLAADKDAIAALQACFPAGTVSGAPTVRAMEIIAELEEEPRGVYAGAVGYFDFRGSMDTCIAIRTMVVEDGIVTVRAGAGLVADSTPEGELEEVRHKAEALLRVLREVERDVDAD